ncbi:MAG: serine/threonine protein kinase [Planctomycetota bacterium]|nr:MAG: serine/threonine protein kinase [Planctomycetota bacterium]
MMGSMNDSNLRETMTLLVSTRTGAKPEAVEIPRRVGSVKLGEVLGEGASGVVVAGFDEALNRRVAVKVLHRQMIGRTSAATQELVAGIRSAAHIRHPNILTIHAVELVGEFPMIVTELVDGVSLRELLARTGPLDVSLALPLVRTVAAAVAVLHENSVVHRDLKPANILLDRDGEPRVCDFGLACEFDYSQFTRTTEAIGGSPLYMAPETFDGHVSPQSDVYALGVMLIEMLCGQAPFLADSITELRRMHERHDPPFELLRRRGVSDELCEMIGRALHKKRIMRYKTAGHLLRALDRIAESSATHASRARLAAAISALPRSKPAGSGRVDPDPAMTTFDLVARRARQKRETRSDFR